METLFYNYFYIILELFKICYKKLLFKIVYLLSSCCFTLLFVNLDLAISSNVIKQKQKEFNRNKLYIYR